MKWIFISALLLAAVANSEDTTPPVKKIGRYRLFHAITQPFSGPDAIPPVPQLFRIDTLTGRTWVYLETATAKSYTQGWIEIGDYPTQPRATPLPPIPLRPPDTNETDSPKK